MNEHFQDAVLAFAKRLGLPGLPEGDGGVMEVVIEKVGRLQLEAGEERARVTLARRIDPHAERTARTALALCHWRENHPWPVHAGLAGGEWLTLTACPLLAEVDLPLLERLAAELSRMHDKITDAG